jgi:hypothetical protein
MSNARKTHRLRFKVLRDEEVTGDPAGALSAEEAP